MINSVSTNYTFAGDQVQVSKTSNWGTNTITQLSVYDLDLTVTNGDLIGRDMSWSGGCGSNGCSGGCQA